MRTLWLMSTGSVLDATVIPVEWGDPFDRLANTTADVFRREFTRLETVLAAYSAVGSVSAAALWAPDRVAQEMADDLTPVLGDMAAIGLDAVEESTGAKIVDRTASIRRTVGNLSNRTAWVGDEAFQSISRLVAQSHRESWTIAKLSKEIRGSLLDAGLDIPGDAKWAQKLPNGDIRYRPGGYWVQRIARTESARVAGGTRFEGALALDLRWKAWSAAKDERTRQTHRDADRQIQYLREPFRVGESLMQYPGDAAGAAKETIFCRCATTYDVSDAEALSAGKP